MRILVVGAGCTGAATALRLRENLGDGAKIQIWDKARGAGGRFTTSRATYPDGLKADMGAQYASVDAKDKASVELMNMLVEAGAAAPVPGTLLAEIAERPRGTSQYRGTNGQNGIVKCMIERSTAEVHFEKRVMKLDQRGKGWIVTPRDGAPQEFDCVMLCVPGCGTGGDNLNKIHGNWENTLTNAQWGHTEVPHDCRYSVALWLCPGHHKALEVFFGESLERRFSGGIELLAWQSRKDGESPDGPQVVVVHTPAGARGNKNQAEPRLISEGCKLLKLPQQAVTSSKIITWFQSQVLSKTSPSPCLVANESPPLILAGDYLTESTFTGCVSSATAAAEVASKLLAGGRPSTGSGGYPVRNMPKAEPNNGAGKDTPLQVSADHVGTSTLTEQEKAFLKTAKKVREILKLEAASAGKDLDKLQAKKLEGKQSLLSELSSIEKHLPQESDLRVKNKDVLDALGAGEGRVS